MSIARQILRYRVERLEAAALAMAEAFGYVGPFDQSEAYGAVLESDVTDRWFRTATGPAWKAKPQHGSDTMGHLLDLLDCARKDLAQAEAEEGIACAS